MESNQQRIAALEEQVRQLGNLMGAKFNELNLIREELRQLKSATPKSFVSAADHSSGQPESTEAITPPPVKPSPFSFDYANNRRERNRKLETFIGTNIINKIGTLILVVGVYIGIKYAIDNQLISPTLRVVLGYLVAFALASTAFFLKKKYTDFSAVMMGGAVAITYFNTYVAHSFYALMPQGVAFGLMLATTVGTVILAIVYDRKVIALIGQIGAYAIPFLLSSGSGNISLLMGYVCIINLGLLYLSVKRDWKEVYLLAFVASWIIFLAVINREDSIHLAYAIRGALLALHFLIFLSTFLVFKLIKKEDYQFREISVMLLNAMLFFAGGYMLIWDIQIQQPGFDMEYQYLTDFAVVLGILHLVLGFMVRRLKPVDGTVHLFLGGVGVSFLTVAVPIAFDGNIITVLWATETAVMAWIFHVYQRKLYHKLTAVLFGLTTVSLMIDRFGTYFSHSIEGAHVIPFLNASFLSSLFTLLCMLFITWLYGRNKQDGKEEKRMSFYHYTGMVAFIGLFLIGALELQWTFPYFTAKLNLLVPDASRSMSILFYSLLYLIGWLMLNNRLLKNRQLAGVLTISVCMQSLLTLAIGFDALGELRSFYLRSHAGSAWGMLGIRYVLFIGIGLLLLMEYKNEKGQFQQQKLYRPWSTLLNVVLLSILCNEFIHWMDIFGSKNQDKLGLSIIAGLYALALVILGILRNQKPQRISGMVLMAMTLVKILFYDLADMGNISRTLVLVVMGLILLAASYMYNRHLEKMKHEE